MHQTTLDEFKYKSIFHHSRGNLKSKYFIYDKKEIVVQFVRDPQRNIFALFTAQPPRKYVKVFSPLSFESIKMKMYTESRRSDDASNNNKFISIVCWLQVVALQSKIIYSYRKISPDVEVFKALL